MHTRLILWVCLLATLGLDAGCVSMSDRDRREYGRLIRAGKRPQDREYLASALALNVVVPGAGHYYLGYYLEGTGLLLSNVIWPLSIVLAVPATVHDTQVYNRQKFVDEALSAEALTGPGGETERTCGACKKQIRIHATHCRHCGEKVERP